jgi:cysteine desulfuration protein SufE
MGKALPNLDAQFQTEDFRVKGCQSQVWLVSEMDAEGQMKLKADSDALISRGLIAVLLSIYSGEKPEDILNFKPTFLNELGLAEHLSPSRANGLYAMLKKIIILAAAERARLHS